MKRQPGRVRLERAIVEALIAGKSQRQIIRDLGVGDRRVRQVHKKALAAGYLDGSVLLPPFPLAVFSVDDDSQVPRETVNDAILLPKKDWIKERLVAGWRPITVFEELGLTVPRASFYRFLHRHDFYRISERRRVVPEIVHTPGECLQVDWGKLRDVFDEKTGRRQTLWMFVGILGYSRYMMVRLVWSNDTVTTIRAIESMFRELGGVPARITSDNPKCFALQASQYEPILNPAFERFCNHYGVMMECLPPRDPQKKGKVERPMNFVRRLYEAHGMEWNGLEESQEYMNRKVAIANERKHGTTLKRPIDELVNIEAATLKPLPPVGYEIEEFAEGKVRQDGHVRFANKYYSLEEQYIGKEVFILATSETVTIFFNGKLIEVHERLPANSPLSKSTKKQHLKAWEQSMREDSVYRLQARKIGPDVERLIEIILLQGNGFIDTRKVWGILSLDKTFERADINEACRRAIEIESFSFQTVRGLLTSKAEGNNDVKPITQSQNHKFVRSLSTYADQLTLIN